MDNVFEEAVLASTTNTDQPTGDANVSTDNSNSTLGSEYDLDFESLYAEDDVDGDIDENAEDEATQEQNSDPTNNAFAQMRTQNKEYSTKINELNAIAQAAGLKDVDELIAKSKEVQIRNQAKKQGIPENVARELAEFKEFKQKMEQKVIDDAQIAKENTLVQNVRDFITKTGLNEDGINKLSDALVKDGLTNDKLMDLPKSALNRILGAYTDSNKQQTLAQKEAIKHELPLNQTSKIDSQALNKELDEIAKQLAGKF